MVPGMVIEPFYVYYKNNLGSADNAGQGLGTAKHSNQTRHMIGNRIEVRKGGFDFSNEVAWQFGQMGQVGACQGEQKCLHINAWATRNWIGYTFYDTAWKTRLAFNLDYASGDSRNNTCDATAPVLVRQPTRLKTSSRRTTSIWVTWTCKPGRTCCLRRSTYRPVQALVTISNCGTRT